MINNKKIGLIAAVEMSGIIGYDNDIPFKDKTDLKRFKELTMGSTVIMGRKTWESLPAPGLLKGRRLHVITRQKYESIGNDLFFYSDLLKAIREAVSSTVWIAGGREIYKTALACQLPDFIDLTIHNYNWFSPIEDNPSVTKQKTVHLPEITYHYQVESEIQNKENPFLFHRKYFLREGWKNEM